MAPSEHKASLVDDDIIKIPLRNSISHAGMARETGPRSDGSYLCFAPRRQPHNHGSDRSQPLRVMPFNFEESGVWIGNLDDHGQRVWPHPSYNELIARAATKDGRFAIPDTIASGTRFQRLRLQCLGENCSHDSNDPFVEHSNPSRLEMLPFENKQSVIIYPFHVRLGPKAGIQNLFAIVHRQKNGEHRFWRADGGYHASYGLTKGRGLVSNGPSPTLKPKSTNNQVPSEVSASFLVRAKRPHEDPIHGPDDNSDDLPLKRRLPSKTTQTVSQPIVRPLRSAPTVMKPGERSSSVITTKKQISATPHKPIILPVMEICMLAYHLSGNGLKLIHHDDVFNIESDEGTLEDPVQELSFNITKKHASYVLVSAQCPLKVIMSTRTVLGVDEDEDDITGGMVLLEFNEITALNGFTSLVRQMAGGQAVQYFSSNDNTEFEILYSTMMDQLGSRRAEISGNHQSAEGARRPDEGDFTPCPAAKTVASQLDIPEAPTSPRSEMLPHTPVSLSASPSGQYLVTPPAENVPSTLSDQSNHPTVLSAVSPKKVLDTHMALSNGVTDHYVMKKELLDLLREVYTKYPSAQDDDQVEKLALEIKSSLLSGNKDRVAKTKMELKVYLIAHHGLAW